MPLTSDMATFCQLKHVKAFAIKLSSSKLFIYFCGFKAFSLTHHLSINIFFKQYKTCGNFLNGSTKSTKSTINDYKKVEGFQQEFLFLKSDANNQWHTIKIQQRSTTNVQQHSTTFDNIQQNSIIFHNIPPWNLFNNVEFEIDFKIWLENLEKCCSRSFQVQHEIMAPYFRSRNPVNITQRKAIIVQNYVL